MIILFTTIKYFACEIIKQKKMTFPFTAATIRSSIWSLYVLIKKKKVYVLSSCKHFSFSTKPLFYYKISINGFLKIYKISLIIILFFRA